MSIARGAEVLRAGGLVVFPTETVYGVGADATNPHAVARIFAAKGRPQFNPLISHVLDLADAERHGELHPTARALVETFWPGPLTIVVPRRSDSPVAELACAGLTTIALRSPSHPLARELLAAFGGPVVAPSANLSGHVSATTAAHAPVPKTHMLFRCRSVAIGEPEGYDVIGEAVPGAHGRPAHLFRGD